MRSFLLILLIFLAGCSVEVPTAEELFQPPRLLTQTAQAAIEIDIPDTPATPTPPVTETESSESEIEVIALETEVMQPLQVWINRTGETHQQTAHKIGLLFEQQTGTPVEFRFVDPERVVGLARSAYLTKQLPDLILHSMEQTPGLVSAGILDVPAANGVIDALGRDTFATGSLTAISPISGSVPAIPSNGWQYVIVFRQDWFSEAGLNAPDTFNNLIIAGDTFYNLRDPDRPEDAPLTTGIVVPTEAALHSTQRVFEWLATANGCRIVNDDIITIQHPACLEALEYYRDLVNRFSPPDYQTDITAVNSFREGRTAMAIIPQSALAKLEAMGDAVGYVTQLTGYETYGRTTNFSQLDYVGIVAKEIEGNEQHAATLQFAQFWLSDAHATWLAVEPLSAISLRTTDLSTAPLPLQDDLAQNERWGFRNGQQAGTVVSTIYEKLTIGPILQRLLSGYIGSSQALIDADSAIRELVILDSN